MADLTGERPAARTKGEHSPPSVGKSAVIDELDVRASAGNGTLVESENKIAEWSIPGEILKLATNSAPDQIKILSNHRRQHDTDLQPTRSRYG